MEVTVFTPTYNRSDLLKRLYNSLCQQSNKNFEWLIVDDGSMDDTESMVAAFINQRHEFPIRYIRQENSGKHIAVNRGAQEAKGTLFFIVDNDDYLSEDAIDSLLTAWDSIRENDEYGGLVFNKCLINGDALGKPKYTQLDCTVLEFRYKFREKGDKAEVIRTSLLRDFAFPDTPGEKFCPEALFFEKIRQKLRYINKNIYYCAYLPDGLSAQIFNVRKRSPTNTCMYYQALSEFSIPLPYRLKALINYYRFSIYLSSVGVPGPRANLFFKCIAFVVARAMIFKDHMRL